MKKVEPDTATVNSLSPITVFTDLCANMNQNIWPATSDERFIVDARNLPVRFSFTTDVKLAIDTNFVTEIRIPRDLLGLIRDFHQYE